MSKSKGVDVGEVVKAQWDAQSSNIFYDLCIKEIAAGNRPGTHLNKTGYANVIKKFQNGTGKLYTGKQFKNRWDWQKDRWRIWKQLKQATGLGWDSTKNTVDASDEWWEAKSKENPRFKDFRNQGMSLELEEKLDLMFNNTVAIGEHAWTPSSGTVPISLGDDSDGEDDDDDEFDDSPIEGQGSVSQRKRSSDSVTLKRNGKAKRPKKMTIANKLSSQIDVMVESINKVSSSSNTASVKEAYSILHSLSEVTNIDSMYFFAIDAFKHKAQREAFVFMLPEKRVQWLEMEYEKSLNK